MSIHSHSHSGSLPLGRWRPVKTAKDYRAMAEECVKWAREAHDDDVRAPLLQLAQTWLDAASKLDGLLANPGTAELNSGLGQTRIVSFITVPTC